MLHYADRSGQRAQRCNDRYEPSRRGAPALAGPPPAAPGPGRALGRGARGRHHHHGRVPPPPPSPRDRATGTSSGRRSRTSADRQRPDGGWNLYEAGAGDLSATIKAYFAMKMAGVSADRPRHGAGPRVGPGAGRADPGQRLHEDHAGAVRRVPLERRAGDAGRDHAAAPVVLLQHLGGLVLVAHGPRSRC